MKIGAAAAGTVAASFLVLGLGLAVRLTSLPTAFRDGHPQVVPLDDLYHAKRIIFSTDHFPRVLDPDPDRGLTGAFCPWPPLYDLALAGQARLLGAHAVRDVLRTAIWVPPLFTALFAALLTAFLAFRSGLAAGLAAGLNLALSPSLVGVSRIGTIDHHFVEPALVLGIAAAAAASLGGLRRPPSVLGRALLLGLALLVALFVQTATLFAAGLALLAILLFGRGREPLLAAGLGFALAAAGVLAYRAARPAGYPESAWYLGTSHAAALVAGAVACAVAARGRSEGERAAGWAPRALLGVAAGTLVAAAIPGAASGIAQGAGFFGSDPWLSQVQEFRPLFRGSAIGALDDLLDLGGGALLALPFAFLAFRRGTIARRVLAVFSIGFLFAAVNSARFTVPAGGILAVAAGLLVSDAVRCRRFGLAAAAAALALAPGIAGCIRFLPDFRSVVPPAARPMLAAADFLRERGGSRGRVLAPWWAGHAFDVLGVHPVVVDNFGAMEGRALFDEAVGLLFSPREETVARYCREHGVRFVVVENPTVSVMQTARIIEAPVSLYLTPASPTVAGKLAYSPTRLLTASFWWRAYLGGDSDGTSPPFRSFRLRYPDPARFGYRLPATSRALQIWEFLPAGS